MLTINLPNDIGVDHLTEVAEELLDVCLFNTLWQVAYVHALLVNSRTRRRKASDDLSPISAQAEAGFEGRGHKYVVAAAGVVEQLRLDQKQITNRCC